MRTTSIPTRTRMVDRSVVAGAADVSDHHDGGVVAGLAPRAVGRVARARVRLSAETGGHLGQVGGRLDVDGHLGRLHRAAVLAVRLGRGQVVGGALDAVVAVAGRR